MEIVVGSTVGISFALGLAKVFGRLATVKNGIGDAG